eukprot:318010-Pyramimonas_sp.AAC.1
MTNTLPLGSSRRARLQRKKRAGAVKGLHGTTACEVPGLFGERHELALAANSGTMINDGTAFRADITLPRTRHQKVESIKKIACVWSGARCRDLC